MSKIAFVLLLAIPAVGVQPVFAGPTSVSAPPGPVAYPVFSGAADEALEFTVSATCPDTGEAAREHPPFGAKFDLLVFEPSGVITAQQIELDYPGVATASVPFALLGTGPVFVSVQDAQVMGPCAAEIVGREIDAATHQTRADLGPVFIGPGNDDHAGDQLPHLPALSGSWDETIAWTFAAMCPATGGNTSAETPTTRFDLVAEEPTGALAPQSMTVELQGGASTPRNREHVLLARQVSLNAFDWFYPGGAGPVNFSVRNLQMSAGCALLPPFARRTDSASGKTTGTVKWFNSAKGYGFIQPSDSD